MFEFFMLAGFFVYFMFSKEKSSYYIKNERKGVAYKKHCILESIDYLFLPNLILISLAISPDLVSPHWVLALLSFSIGIYMYHVGFKDEVHEKLIANNVYDNKYEYKRDESKINSDRLLRLIIVGLCFFILVFVGCIVYFSVLEPGTWKRVVSPIDLFFKQYISPFLIPIIIGLMISAWINLLLSYRYLCKLEKEIGKPIMFYYGNYNLPPVDCGETAQDINR